MVFFTSITTANSPLPANASLYVKPLDFRMAVWDLFSSKECSISLISEYSFPIMSEIIFTDSGGSNSFENTVSSCPLNGR